MGIENPVHLLFIAAIALIVLGPKRLPALARALGQAVREFRASLEEGAKPQPEGEHGTASAGEPVASAEEPVANAGEPVADRAGEPVAGSVQTPEQGASDER